MRLWFDPAADIVKHEPPRKPLDPSRPIRRAPIVADAEPAGDAHVAPESDAA